MGYSPGLSSAMARNAYPTDLTDEQWSRVVQSIPPVRPGGRPRSVDMREVVNGILYLNRTGCAWRLLPHDLPPWGTVHYYYRRFRLEGVWDETHDRLREEVRVAAGKDRKIVRRRHRQPVGEDDGKRGAHGYDAGKKINGRKRHIVVDTLGMIIAVVVHAASIQDRDGARLVMAKLPGWFPRLKLIWADGGYAGQLVGWAAAFGGWALEVVKRTDDVAGFKVLPHRWVVEADVRLAGVVPAAQQGLRVPDGQQRGDDQDLDEQPHAPPAEPGVNTLSTHPLSGGPGHPAVTDKGGGVRRCR